MPIEKLDHNNPLADFFVLYDKDLKPMLDPCFIEYSMLFVCGHSKSLFKPEYTMSDQYCDECAAMREVKTFEFIGVPDELIDRDRPYEIQISMSEWDVESKAGMYLLCKPKKMPNGKFIKQIDYFAAGNFGIPTQENKSAELARARISDQSAIAVFEIPDYAFNVPAIMETAKRFLEYKDVRVLKVIPTGRKGDGTFTFNVDTWITDPKKIVVPAAKAIT